MNFLKLIMAIIDDWIYKHTFHRFQIYIMTKLTFYTLEKNANLFLWMNYIHPLVKYVCIVVPSSLLTVFIWIKFTFNWQKGHKLNMVIRDMICMNIHTHICMYSLYSVWARLNISLSSVNVSLWNAISI